LLVSDFDNNINIFMQTEAVKNYMLLPAPVPSDMEMIIIKSCSATNGYCCSLASYGSSTLVILYSIFFHYALYIQVGMSRIGSHPETLRNTLLLCEE
jgi:hypothetical protein